MGAILKVCLVLGVAAALIPSSSGEFEQVFGLKCVKCGIQLSNHCNDEKADLWDSRFQATCPRGDGKPVCVISKGSENRIAWEKNCILVPSDLPLPYCFNGKSRGMRTCYCDHGDDCNGSFDAAGEGRATEGPFGGPGGGGGVRKSGTQGRRTPQFGILAICLLGGVGGWMRG